MAHDTRFATTHPPTNPADRGVLPVTGSSTAASAPRTSPSGCHYTLATDRDDDDLLHPQAVWSVALHPFSLYFLSIDVLVRIHVFYPKCKRMKPTRSTVSRSLSSTMVSEPGFLI